MSTQEEKRKKSGELLHALTDIDDRFVEEAMEQDAGQKPGAGQTPDVSQNPETGQTPDVGQNPGADQNPETGQTPGAGQNDSGKDTSNGGKIRRYSRWALTAAACLVVLVAGRTVLLHQPGNLTEQKNASLVKTESEAVIRDEAADAADTAVKMQDEDREESVQDQLSEDIPAAENQAAENQAAENQAAENQAAEGPAAQNQAAEGPAAQNQAADIPDAENLAEENQEADAQILEAAGESASSVQMANPFIDSGTLQEAEKIAGFSMGLPDADASSDRYLFRAVEGEMLEVICLDEEQEEEYRIRKGIGEDDISGDYTEYAQESTLTLPGGIRVTLRGDQKEQWTTAVWTQEADGEDPAYAYAVCGRGRTFTTQQIRRIAEAMMQED